jgi:hypothetical protein
MNAAGVRSARVRPKVGEQSFDVSQQEAWQLFGSLGRLKHGQSLTLANKKVSEHWGKMAIWSQ